MTVTIEYFHSLSSPWAYLGAQRFYEIAARHGATIVPRPILVLQENGGIPLRTRPDARQNYHALELDRWRKYLDLPLKLKPRYYPTNPIESCYLVIAARQLGLDANLLSFRLLEALWANDRDTLDVDVRKAVADEAGLDGTALLAHAARQEVLDEWQRNKDDAIALGIFGTPNYVLDGEIFWGQDRLDFLDRKLQARAGAQPSA
jgi:2-hydroxychromene-2-carboxylate isomerase